MTKPSSFILSTDFPTFKNDASANGTINLAGGLVIAAGATLTASSDFVIGTQGAIARSRWASSVESYTWYSGQYILYNRVGTSGGSPAPYTLGLFVFRTTPTTMRMQVIIPNPYGATLTGDVAETVLMYTETFVPPNS